MSNDQFKAAKQCRVITDKSMRYFLIEQFVVFFKGDNFNEEIFRQEANKV